ncbi:MULTISPECIES: hypothetical protein [Pectobacterium]|uniref:hypothetical protein n=1 Tax=Pectobacterium TaxID=122277 RepID=UPI001F11B781|nr:MULTISPECIES: hypothetical protein [Pectobacterium]MCE9729794.1 hypothetical protein [Pectobacterium sp. IFB5596]MCH5049358.1 hypothetical protein [Pectobacterium aquaticum]
MWRIADIRFPTDMTAINCAIVPVHPWVYGVGQKAGAGNYLSPANAVAYLASRLQAAAGETAVTVLMVSSTAQADFMQQLERLTGIFPAPAFTQVARMAKAAAALDTVKMQLPAKSQALPAAVPLSVSTSRQALNAQRIAEAQTEAAVSASADGIKSQLANFAAERGAMLATISQGLNALQQGSARAWVFTGKGHSSVIAAELVKDIPQPSAVYTAAMMFVGDSLDALEGMIHEPDNYTRP